MGAVERVVDRAKHRSRAMRAELGRQIREARITLGLSQADVGRAVGVSGSTISRIERGEAHNISFDLLCRVLAAVGLDLSARAYPGGSPVRDRAHLELVERLLSVLPRGVAWRTEVPLPNPDDLRTWDALVRCDGVRIGIEAETRPRDVQELARRLALKERDGGVDRVVLLLSNTRHKRELLRSNAARFAVAFPVRSQDALAALREGRDPGGNAIILL